MTLPLTAPLTPVPRCTWRICRRLATATVTAGTPGGPGNYATTYTCDTHIEHVARRTSNIADGQPAVIEPLPH